MLFGDTSANNSNSVALIMRNSKAFQDASRPRTPSATEMLMVNSVDADILLSELIPAVTKLKMCVFMSLHSLETIADRHATYSVSMPLLRWIEIQKDYDGAGRRLANMDGISQALFLSLAALGSRTSTSELIVGKGAPSLLDLSQNKDLRSGLSLCQYGERRERVASELLNLAHRKINENMVLVTPSLQSAAALATVEMLILGMSNRFTLRIVLD
jgi:hypothetical protein